MQSKSSIMSQKHSKNTLFVTVFHPRSKDAEGQKMNCQIIHFLLRFAFNSLADLRVQFRLCDWKSPKLSVSGLTKRAIKNCNCFQYGACVNPGSVKVSSSALHPLLETLLHIAGAKTHKLARHFNAMKCDFASTILLHVALCQDRINTQKLTSKKHKISQHILDRRILLDSSVGVMHGVFESILELIFVYICKYIYIYIHK